MTQLVKTPLETRALFRLSGDDVKSLMQGLITQDMDRLSPISAIYSLLLTPQGKILYDFFLIETADGVLVDIHRDHAPAFMQKLKLYRLRAQVEIEPLDDWSVGVVFGDVSEAEPGRIMGLGKTKAIGFVDPRVPELGMRVLSPTIELEAALNVIDAEQGTPDAYQDFRRSKAVPEGGADFAPETVFPLDVNMDALNGIDYKKGCFVGQEVSSRMKRKGSIRKRVYGVSGGESSEGKLTQGEKTVGTMLADGLAILRLDRFEAEVPITLETSTQVTVSRPAYLEKFDE